MCAHQKGRVRDYNTEGVVQRIWNILGLPVVIEGEVAQGLGRHKLSIPRVWGIGGMVRYRGWCTLYPVSCGVLVDQMHHVLRRCVLTVHILKVTEFVMHLCPSPVVRHHLHEIIWLEQCR